jgi:ligand-binding sensor domain-containing protein
MLATTGDARALAPDRWFDQYTVAQWRVPDGVPGARVRAITQTADGQLWMGTFGGVARYDGTRIVKLETTAPFKRIGDVTGLLAARDGRLWIAPSIGDPVCARGDALAACFPLGQHLARGARIADMREDHTGAVWIATSAGIYRFGGGTLHLEHPTTDGAIGRPSVVLRDRQGRLWVGGDRGLFITRDGALVLHTTPAGPAIAAVHALGEGRDGSLWVARDNALLHIEGDETRVHSAPADLLAGPLTQVLEDRDGSVWVGSRGGLVRFRAGRFERANRRDGLPDDDIMTVFEDREGSLWLGTRGGGLVQITDRALNLLSGPPSLRETFIDTLAEDATGTLWIGSGRGLTSWRDGRERTYTRDDGLPGQRVRAVHPADDGTLWVGTERGLTRWHAGKFEPSIAVPESVTGLHVDEEGGLWVGGPGTVARLVDGAITRFALDSTFEGAAFATSATMMPEPCGWPRAGDWGVSRVGGSCAPRSRTTTQTTISAVSAASIATMTRLCGWQPRRASPAIAKAGGVFSARPTD